jgi:hypothetical protein
MKRVFFVAALAALLASPALVSTPAAAQQGFTPRQSSGAMMQGSMRGGRMMRPMRHKRMMHYRRMHSKKMMHRGHMRSM